MTISKVIVPAQEEHTIEVTSNVHSFEAYWSPITDRGWWIDGDTYITNTAQIDAMIEVLEAVYGEIVAGNIYDENRPASEFKPY